MAQPEETRLYDREAARQARVDLAAAYRLAVRFGFHEAIDNHFSLLLPGQDALMLLNPYPLHWTEVTAGNLLLADFEGNRLEGEHEVEPTALHIHAPLHQANPRGFRCVLHTHMPYASAIACRQGGRLEMVHQVSSRFDGDVAYLEDYNGLVLDRTEGNRIARVMGDKNVLFMANHGVITAGRTVAEAFDRLYFLERACKVQVLAEMGGHPLQRITHETAELLRRQRGEGENPAAELHFAALKRILDREEPDYAD
ncbi:MAG: aldolase [Deltaproteobacteria bacterium]|nr:aldolase [Deltaproteobacteria bacterium]